MKRKSVAVMISVVGLLSILFFSLSYTEEGEFLLFRHSFFKQNVEMSRAIAGAKRREGVRSIVMLYRNTY